MTINEAIKLLEEMPRVTDHQKLLRLPDAIKLGIESLKRIEHQRAHFGQPWAHLLPGETRE